MKTDTNTAISGLAALVEGPWAMEPEALRRVQARIAELARNAEQAHELRGLENTLAAVTGESTAPLTLQAGVAVVPISGPIVNSRTFARWLGGTAVGDVRLALADARAAYGRGEAAGVALVIDSPGGTVGGVADLADEIRQMAAEMPVVASIQTLGASAAYWLAAQASRVLVTSTGAAGSIGVYTVLYDTTRMFKDAGVDAELVSSGGVKGGGVMGVPLTKEYRASVQEQIDAYFAAFKGAVVKGRPALAGSIDAVATGHVWIGPAAVTQGLADAVGTVNAAAEAVRAMDSARKRKGGAAAAVGGNEHAGGAGEEVSMKTDGNASGASGSDPKGSQITQAASTASPGVLAAAAGAALALSGGAAADTAGVLALERERVAQIDATAGAWSALPNIQAEKTRAIKEGISPEAFAARVLAIAATAQAPMGNVPNAGAAGGGVGGGGGGAGGVSVGGSGQDRLFADITLLLTDRALGGAVTEAALAGGDRAERLARRLGVAASGRSGGAEVLSRIDTLRASGFGGVSLRKLAALTLEAQGGKAPHDDFDLWRAVHRASHTMAAVGNHTTSDFSGILGNVARKVLLAGYDETPSTYEAWCVIDDAQDYKTKEFHALSEAPNLDKMLEGQKAKFGTFNERKHSYVVDPYSKAWGLTYQAMRNDDLSAFTRIPALMGVAARRLPNNLIYGLLVSGSSNNGPTMSDNNQLFNSAHGNLPTGAALSATSLQGAFTAMRTQKGFGPDAPVLNIVPRTLLVPAALEFTAEQIRTSEFDPAASNKNVANTLRNRFQTLVEPRLDATSTTAWWTIADKNQAQVAVVGFLDGQREPRIDQLYGQNDPLTIGYQATVMGVGAAFVGWEGILRGN